MTRLALLIVLFSCMSASGNVREVVWEVNQNFAYKADDPNDKTPWQSPKETMRLGTGDCEDYVFLVRYKLIQAGADPSLIQVLEGKLRGIGHMVLRYKGYWIDCYGMYKRYPKFIITQFWSSPTINIILARSI